MQTQQVSNKYAAFSNFLLIYLPQFEKVKGWRCDINYIQKGIEQFKAFDGNWIAPSIGGIKNQRYLKKWFVVLVIFSL